MAFNADGLIDYVGGGLPLYIKGLRLEVHYLPEAVADATSEDRQEVLRGALSGEFQSALRCGFFSGTRFEQLQSSTVTTKWLDSGTMIVEMETTGGWHSNVTTALLKSIIGLHHTPADSYARTKQIVEEDGNTKMLPRQILQDIVSSIQIVDVVAADAYQTKHENLLEYNFDEGILLPSLSGISDDWLAYCEARPLVVKQVSPVAWPDHEIISNIDEAFMNLCGSNVFKRLADFDVSGHDDGDFWIRNGKDIVLDDYSGQLYGAAELVHCLSQGRATAFEMYDES